MHWTFSKGSLNLRKQKLILLFVALYLLKLVNPEKSQKHAADAACLTAWGRQIPESSVSTLTRDQLPFPSLWWSGGRKASRLQTAAVMGYPWLESGEQQQFCQHSTLLQARTGDIAVLVGPPPTNDSAERNTTLILEHMKGYHFIALWWPPEG